MVCPCVLSQDILPISTLLSKVWSLLAHKKINKSSLETNVDITLHVVDSFHWFHWWARLEEDVTYSNKHLKKCDDCLVVFVSRLLSIETDKTIDTNKTTQSC